MKPPELTHSAVNSPGTATKGVAIGLGGVVQAKGGGTYEYPINETTELVNLTRLACHARPTTSEQVMGQMPMFGIEISPSDNYTTDRPKDPFVAFKHYGNGDLVKATWGYPKRYAFGDQTNLGMVVEVKVPSEPMPVMFRVIGP